MSTLGPILFHVLVHYTDDGMECVFNKSADDSKLSGTVNIHEEMDNIQMELNNLEDGKCGPHEIQQGQVQDPTPGSGKPIPTINIDWAVNM